MYLAQITNYFIPKQYSQLQKFGAFDYDCGIPASLTEGTYQQWDFPNAWPSHNHMIIEAFRTSGSVTQITTINHNNVKVLFL